MEKFSKKECVMGREEGDKYIRLLSKVCAQIIQIELGPGEVQFIHSPGEFGLHHMGLFLSKLNTGDLGKKARDFVD